MLLIYTYFQQCSTTGHYPEALPYLFSFCSIVQITCFYGAILLIAKGLFITRNQLPWNEVKTVFVAVLGFSITSFVYSTSNMYLWAFWFVVYCSVAGFILASSRSTLFLLFAQVREDGNSVEGSAKLRDFIRFFV